MIMEFSKIEVITSLKRLGSLKFALGKVGVHGITVVQAIGCGVQNGTQEYEPELNDEMELLPKQIVIVLVENSKVDEVIDVIKKELFTGHIGDGKIFITPISNVIRVRTGEEGEDALK
jgi:nitrogen regulatory protein P-II 1